MYERRVYDPATRTGVYGDPGEPGEVVIDIPTDAGVAHGYVLPGPTPRLTLIDPHLRGGPSAAAAPTTCSAATPAPGQTQN